MGNGKPPPEAAEAQSPAAWRLIRGHLVDGVSRLSVGHWSLQPLQPLRPAEAGGEGEGLYIYIGPLGELTNARDEENWSFGAGYTRRCDDLLLTVVDAAVGMPLLAEEMLRLPVHRYL